MSPDTDKTYRTEIEVRGYELDSFGHVNHANYLNYFEFARWQLLSQEKVTLELFKKWDRFPVIASIEIKYLKPTFMGDRLTIETKLIEYRRSSSTFEQKIIKNDQEVCVAKVRSVLVNSEGRPAEAPPELDARWKSIVAEKPSGAM
jgi:YbgC/YbaW family acyl-CoA thioester hydrolase